MGRNDRPFIFSNNTHCCDERGSRTCRIDCPSTNGDFNRRIASKARRAAARRDIRNAELD
jgi:hypothetical protein